MELPPVRPVVVEAWRYAARCRGCGTRTKDTYPAGLEPTRTFGPQVEVLLGYFHERHHVGYERLVVVCRDVFGLAISEGGIDRALRRLAERARPTYEAIGAQARNLTYAVEADGYDGRVRAIELRHLLGRAVHLHAIRETLTPASFALRRRRIENAVDRLLFRTFLPDWPDAANALRLRARYRDHRARLFVFFDRPDVPPTNNASERDLRPSVIHRKVIGGFRSARGAEASAIRTTILVTARKQGRNLLDAFRAVAGPSPLQATPTHARACYGVLPIQR